MPEYTLRNTAPTTRNPAEAAYWDEHVVDMRERNSVLDAILHVRGEDRRPRSASVAHASRASADPVRAHERKARLACNTHLVEAAGRRATLGGSDGSSPA